MPFVRASLLTTETEAAYRPYGEIVAPKSLPVTVNGGTAQRYNRLCEFDNSRPEIATLNLCRFDCIPPVLDGGRVKITTLEKHQHSTQIFVSLSPDAKYLLVVCGGDDRPDFDTLQAFLVDGTQAILGASYYPGTWHSGFIAIRQGSYLCLVNEADTPGDTTPFTLDDPILVDLGVLAECQPPILGDRGARELRPGLDPDVPLQ